MSEVITVEADAHEPTGYRTDWEAAATLIGGSAAPAEIAGRAAADLNELWGRLAQPAQTPPTFHEAMVAGLPEPARRWLTHAIAPGSKLHRAVVMDMGGQIRLGHWLSFRAVQLHAPPDGYVWAARTRLGPRPAVTWHEGRSDSTAIAEWKVGPNRLPVEITVGADGRLVAATTARWGNPNGEPWGLYPCGGMVDDEVDFGGIKIPTRVRASWFFGTDRWAEGEFFRAAITTAAFL